VDHFDSFSAGLFSPASVQFYTVTQNLFVRSDFIERNTIPDARIQRATRFVREYQESPDPLRLSQWKGIKS
jgi:hypothetical protein